MGGSARKVLVDCVDNEVPRQDRGILSGMR